MANRCLQTNSTFNIVTDNVILLIYDGMWNYRQPEVGSVGINILTVDELHA